MQLSVDQRPTDMFISTLYSHYPTGRVLDFFPVPWKKIFKGKSLHIVPIVVVAKTSRVGELSSSSGGLVATLNFSLGGWGFRLNHSPM